MKLEDVTLTTLAMEIDGEGIATVRLNRPDKRNALDAGTIEQLVDLFSALPRSGVRAVVLCAAGDHFSAGLDLVEHHRQERSASDFMHVCLRWHEAFNKMEYSGVPVIAALKGAVVGGGLELASAAHIRVADRTTYFALPEGQRGLFTGGGIAALLGGYSGTASFSCGATAYPVTGDGSSVTIELLGGTSVTLVGGPYTYAGSSNSITFANGYGSFVWSAGGSTLNCVRV